MSILPFVHGLLRVTYFVQNQRFITKSENKTMIEFYQHIEENIRVKRTKLQGAPILFTFCINITWDKVFKNRQSKICGRQPLKKFTWSIVEYLDSFLIVFNFKETSNILKQT